MLINTTTAFIASFLLIITFASSATAASPCGCQGILNTKLNSYFSKDSEHLAYIYREFYSNTSSYSDYVTKYKKHEGSGKAFYKGVPLGGMFSSAKDYKDFKESVMSTQYATSLDFSNETHRTVVTYGLGDKARSDMLKQYNECIKYCENGIYQSLDGDLLDLFEYKIELRSNMGVLYIVKIEYSDSVIESLFDLDMFANKKMHRSGLPLTFERIDTAKSAHITVYFQDEPGSSSPVIAVTQILPPAPAHLPEDASETTYSNTIVSRIAKSLESFTRCCHTLNDLTGPAGKNHTEITRPQIKDTQEYNNVIFKAYKHTTDPQEIVARTTAGNISALINVAQTIASGDRAFPKRILYLHGDGRQKLVDQVTSIRRTDSDPVSQLTANCLSDLDATLRLIYEGKRSDARIKLQQIDGQIAELWTYIK